MDADHLPTLVLRLPSTVSPRNTSTSRTPANATTRLIKACRARANLAGSYWSAGRTGEAIRLEEAVLADRVRLLGGDHPDTLTARANLAASYWSAGHTGEAISLLEAVLADSMRLLGDEHPDTVAARSALESWRSPEPDST